MVFGNKDRLAIEATAEDVLQLGSPQLSGLFFMWIGGERLGYATIPELLWMAANDLEGSLSRIGQYWDSHFEGKDATAIMDRIYHPKLGYSQKFGDRFMIIHHPPFDGLYVIRVDGPVAARLIWREGGDEEAHELVLERGEYESVVKAFVAWLDEEHEKRGLPTWKD